MKFKVKTLDHRDFTVQFSDLKKVYELKRHICRLRGVWLHPEKYRILYGGRVLDDLRELRSYCIDERKFLLMLPKTAPPQKQRQTTTNSMMSYIPEMEPAPDPEPPITQPMYIPTGEVKEHIMKLGPWKEPEVRRALLISLNNPNRAIEYLIRGKAPFPRMVSPPSSRLFLTKSKKGLRDDILIPQSPELQNECDSGYEFEVYSSHEQLTSRENVSSPKTKALEVRDSMHEIQRLVNIGFPQEIVMEAYRACDRNIEEAAILLFEQYVDEFDRIP